MAGKDTEVVVEARTTLGEPRGIEFERPEPEGTPVRGEAYDPEKIDIVTRSMTIDQILARIRAETIDLNADLQRCRHAWNGVRQSRLVELVLLKIPLPAIYVAEDAGENWTVVDGIQRLTTIARFVDPAVIGDTPLVMEGLEYLGGDYVGKGFKELPPRLQRRLKETELAVHVIRHGTPAPVKFNILSRLNDGGMPLTAQEIRHALTPGRAREILADWAQGKEFRKAIGNGIVDEGMADRELVLRFIAFRLTPLGAYPDGDFEQFLGEAMRALNDIPAVPAPDLASETEPAPEPEESPDAPPAAATTETVDEVGDMDLLADDHGDRPAEDEGETPESEPEPATVPDTAPATPTLAGLDSEFKSAMTAAFAIFGEEAFRKPHGADEGRNPINKALFETIAVNLAALDPDRRDMLVERGGAVREQFIDLIENRKFILAVSQGTGDPAKVRTRFSEIEKLFKKVLS
ncbi:MAG: hypothetical protein OEZ03_07725 [Alphaproteobacteria bacterium]|nr:hypothetical protein [Alphaproteobacteria bacterium]